MCVPFVNSLRREVYDFKSKFILTDDGILQRKNDRKAVCKNVPGTEPRVSGLRGVCGSNVQTGEEQHRPPWFHQESHLPMLQDRL